MKYLLLVLLMTACAATGSLYSQTPVTNNTAQIVIYRSSEVFGADEYVEINGNEICRLGRETYFTRNVNPGLVNVSITTLSDKSSLAFNTERGQRYFVKVGTNSGKTAAAIGGGLLGAALAGGDDYHIEQVSNQQGMSEVSDKKETITCK